MHEYYVTKSITELAVREAEQAGAQRIIEIRLVIGDLSSIIDESVQMNFDMISEGTLAEGARLSFRRTPARFYCSSCQKDFVKPAKGFDCPDCGTMGKLTDAGREFYIESMDVE
jgi:hydrogenase nickel incorporation protein HypA/HybF